MDNKGKIEPHKITKPIQLLASWLLGLTIINGSFLVSASQIHNPIWASGALVIAAIINVPLFLFSIFLLQTKFRPEMQEDSFYSQYLESKTGNTERQISLDSIAALRENVASIEKVIAEKVEGGLDGNEIEKLMWSSVTVRLNKSLDNFKEVTKQLSKRGIPIHETFGGGAGNPSNPFRIALGSGFELEQLRSLVDTILPITDGWISFAHDEDEGPGQYDNQVLIGAYGSYAHGIELSKAKVIIENHNTTIADAYKI